jgi:hypothetical protein
MLVDVPEPSARALAVLRHVYAAGAVDDQLSDAAAIEQCVCAGWLIADDERGYALTCDGRAIARAFATAGRAPGACAA